MINQQTDWDVPSVTQQNEPNLKPVRAAPPPPAASNVTSDEFGVEINADPAGYIPTYEPDPDVDNGQYTGTDYSYSNPFSTDKFDGFEQGNDNNGTTNYGIYDSYQQPYDQQYQFSDYGASGNQINDPSHSFPSQPFQEDSYPGIITTDENQPQDPSTMANNQDYETSVMYGDNLATSNFTSNVGDYNYGEYQTPNPIDDISYAQTSNEFNAYNPLTPEYDDNNTSSVNKLTLGFESEFQQQQQNSRSFDPFSWEEQEKKFEPSLTPKYAPPPRPERPPAPNFKQPSPEKQTTTCEKDIQVHNSEASKDDKQVEEEDDAWKQFNKMNEQVNLNLQKILGNDSMGDAGKEFIADLNLNKKQFGEYDGDGEHRATVTHRSTRPIKSEQIKPDPVFDDKDSAAIELAKSLATKQMIYDWKTPDERESSHKQQNDEIPKQSSESISDGTEKEDLQIHLPKETETVESDDLGVIKDVQLAWATTFEKAQLLPPSESDWLLVEKLKQDKPAEIDEHEHETSIIQDPFIPVDTATATEEVYDPFDVKIDDIIAATKKKIELEKNREENEENVVTDLKVDKSPLSSPTEADSITQHAGFNDDFDPNCSLEEALYDDDDTQPLKEFIDSYKGDGWDLMIRYPFKKKLMNDRYWKPCFVKIHENLIFIYNNHEDEKPFHKLSISATYSLSDVSLQPYDAFGKIHTVKFQHVMYKERLGIRPGQISKIMEGQITKYGKPIEHAAHVTVLAKFGSLNYNNLITFIATVEDLLFRSPLSRDIVPQYKQEEIQIHCYDEYEANVDKDGIILSQKARVRIFSLAFVSGSPYLEIGLNDRRREGKEIVRRKDILPLYTERWIKIENPEFRNELVDAKEWAENQIVKIKPPDGCFFEIMRFRIRPPQNREKPLIIKASMNINGSKIEIEVEAIAAAQQHKSKGTVDSTRLIPCEDICIRFPIPEEWIYIFREERHWGVGSVHSKTRKAGKMKNLRDRLVGAVQQIEHTLIEVGIGEAKYEHLFRSLVWRIPRLPEKESTSYKPYKLKCSFELSSFDLVPEAFARECHVDFTMPLATISNSVVRSVSVEEHEDSDRIEKFVRYLSKCHYLLEIDYLNCNTDTEDTQDPPISDQPQPLIEEKTRVSATRNDDSYFLDNSAGIGQRSDSTSSDEEGVNGKSQIPVISINMKGYGY